MAWAIDVRVGDPVLKILLIAIANYANESRRAWPSQSQLAYDTELSERTIRRRLDELKELGLIDIEHRRKDGRAASSIITLKTTGQNGRLTPEQPDTPDISTGQNQPFQPDTKVAANEPSKNHHKIEPSDSIPSLAFGDARGEFKLCEAEALTPKQDAELFFDRQFWPAYPKRFGSNPKEPAKRKLTRAILRGEKPEDILLGVKRLYSAMQRSGKLGTEYVPMALTWINRQQWKDDPQPAGNGKTNRDQSFFDVAQSFWEQANAE